MSFLEELKHSVRAAKEFDWCGQKIWLRKLSAQDHLDLFGRIKAAETDSREDTVAFHVSLVSRTLCDEGGELAAVGDAGKAFLMDGIAFDDLVALGEMSLAHSGYKTAEKKTS